MQQETPPLLTTPLIPQGQIVSSPEPLISDYKIFSVTRPKLTYIRKEKNPFVLRQLNQNSASRAETQDRILRLANIEPMNILLLKETMINVCNSHQGSSEAIAHFVSLIDSRLNIFE